MKKMVADFKRSNTPVPRNKNLKNDQHQDQLLRELDCAAIEFMHAAIFKEAQQQMTEKGITDIKLFETTRGVFTEGGEAFDGAGLFAKSHIQICVRNLNCIKGFFMPRKETDFMQYLQEQYALSSSQQL